MYSDVNLNAAIKKNVKDQLSLQDTLDTVAHGLPGKEKDQELKAFKLNTGR